MVNNEKSFWKNPLQNEDLGLMHVLLDLKATKTQSFGLSFHFKVNGLEKITYELIIDEVILCLSCQTLFKEIPIHVLSILDQL